MSNTRLVGDGFEPKHNTPGTPYTRDDETTRRHTRYAQAHPTVGLTAELAPVVADTLIQAAAARGWIILQAAVIANHVHVVVTDCPDDGPAVRRVLKGVTQAALSDRVGQPVRWWTAGGSDRYKHGQAAIDAAVGYVAKQPGLLAGVRLMKPFVVVGGEVRF